MRIKSDFRLSLKLGKTNSTKGNVTETNVIKTVVICWRQSLYLNCILLFWLPANFKFGSQFWLGLYYIFPVTVPKKHKVQTKFNATNFLNNVILYTRPTFLKTYWQCLIQQHFHNFGHNHKFMWQQLFC